MFKIMENKQHKIFASEDFNYVFNKVTGFHAQWGKTKEEDPQRCKYGPIIADIEIVAACTGPGGKLCNFCYKSNTPEGHSMSLEDYKIVFSKLPKTLTQIAFGVDATGLLNKDLFKIMEYTRENGIIPNLTIADISEDTASKLGKVAGAVAVSWYGVHSSKEYCYNSIKYLSDNLMNKKPDNTLKSVNMHFMLSKETYPYIDELINDIKNDSRLKELNAVVFLSLKQKGRGTKFNQCSKEEFKSVVDRMLEAGIGFGFDSCSQPKFAESIKDHPRAKEFIQMSENCESFSGSIYITEKGLVYPCSFMEKMQWNSLDYNKSEPWNLLDDSIKDSKDFLSKVWNSDRALTFSSKSLACASCGEGCQVYSI